MVHMLIGIPGSGKSTFAKTLSATLKCDIASTDKVRKDNPKWKEEQVWPEVYRLCAEALKDGKDIIFDATNITPKVRERFVSEVEKYGVKMVMGAYYFNTSKEECFSRVVERNKLADSLFLPPEVVYSYGEKIVFPTLEEGFCFIKTIEFGKIIKSENKK